MRFALLATLTLAACSSDPAPVTDAGVDTGPAADLGADVGTADAASADTGTDTGPTIDDPPVTDTGPTADASDAGAVDTGTDVVRVDGAPCIPACAAGSVCAGGVCEAVDGGADAGAVDSGPPRPSAEPREFQSCEPRGTSCGGDAGVTCVRPGQVLYDAGVRGACLRSCTSESECPADSYCIGTLCRRRCVEVGAACEGGTRCESEQMGAWRYCS